MLPTHRGKAALQKGTFGGTCGVTRVWACLWVSRLGPRCRSPGASPRCRRLRWIVSSSPLRPRRGRRHPDAPRPPRRRACHRSIVSPQSFVAGPSLQWLRRQCPPPLPSPALAAAHRPLARRRRGSRRCVAVSSRRRRPSRSRPFERRRRAPARRRPSSSSRAPRSPLVVCASSPPRRRRSLSSSSSSRAAFAVIVAAVLVVNTLGHGSRCRCVVVRVVSVVISVLAAIAGYHRLVVTVVRRPSPPLSSLILASILTRRRAQPPCRRHR